MEKNQVDQEVPEFKDLVELTEAADTMESDFIISYLNSCGIDAYKQYTGAGGYLHIYAGFSYEGVLIMVPKAQYDEAVSVLETLDLSQKTTEMDDFDAVAYKNYRKEQFRSFRWLFYILLAIIPLIVLMIIQSGSF